ncbi:MAG: hypothetical protein KME21_04875 [Desmonostoc vinosum HA7617-LM4]|nr:hypothetical protein [Desmonostoc vinosum HA7617-LM4]
MSKSRQLTVKDLVVEDVVVELDNTALKVRGGYFSEMEALMNQMQILAQYQAAMNNAQAATTSAAKSSPGA